MSDLEPESAALVSRLTSGGGDPLAETDVHVLRARMAQMLIACGPKPLPVASAERRRLRDVDVILYRPPVARPDAAALLYFHGGAYTHLSAATHDSVARYLRLHCMISKYASWSRMGDGRYLLSRDLVEGIRSAYLLRDEDRLDSRVSPVLAGDLGGLPPALIVAAEFDPLVDEAAHYARRLREAGVAVSYRFFPGTIHAFMILAGVISRGYEALDVVGEWVGETR